MGIMHILLDDKDAREKANNLGLIPLGTIGVLIKAHQSGFVTDLKAEITNLMNKSRIHLDTKLIDKVLKL